jgi:hypothetical protein
MCCYSHNSHESSQKESNTVANVDQGRLHEDLEYALNMLNMSEHVL